ncbi:hypothetical protein CWI84_09510 [Idiomarina tyrosinivorans]|uniref:Uncharacterized protein n=1 Tax=Idiomarina tyrosinivorans TaxID=1445662 RepID=A0A432ZPN0_9GAMM|nr:hypothetical protein [Idiomarina tyrosinivorans]RUO79854.1 hypothetical protein CWI84_09510 [Idiomarina tyrosinivorans]
MKVSDLIWPDKWMSFGVRVSVVIVAWILWLIVSYLKYFVFHVDGVLQLVGFYPILIIWTYLFNRSLSMAPGSAYFDANNVRLQAARTCIFVMAVIAFLGMLFIGDC